MYLQGACGVRDSDSDFVDATEVYRNALEQESDADRLKDELYTMMRACRISSDREGFMKYALRALALGEVTSETAFELGEYYRMTGDEKEAGIWYYNAAHETEPSLDHRYHDEYPLRFLDNGK